MVTPIRIITPIPRKNKATSETLKIILKAIENGMTQKDAAILAGVDQDTITNWKKNSDFSDQMRLAEIQFKSKLLKVIDKAALTDPKEAKWRLERLYPEEFSLRPQKDTEPAQGQDTLEKILQKLSKVVDENNYASVVKRSPSPFAI